jgi:hypothetical protein
VPAFGAVGGDLEKVEAISLLSDFSALPSHPRDPELALVEAALFVEQTFGIALSEADFTEENFGSPAAIERFVLARLGGL